MFGFSYSFTYSSFTMVTSQGRGNHSVFGTACDCLQEIVGQMFCKEVFIFNEQLAWFVAAIYSVDIFFEILFCCLGKGRKRPKSIATGTTSRQV